jgi:hypothetical protein
MRMKKLAKLIRNESGQAMVIALVCLVVGALIVAPLISYTATSANGVVLKNSSLMGRYAADSGIEDVIWALKYGQPLPTELSQSLNDMQVNMSTVSKGFYILIAGDWVADYDGVHSRDLTVTSSLVWDSGANAYKYTVTANYTGVGECWLQAVGVRLPVGYTYQTGSAALFSTNPAQFNPDDEPDDYGARMLEWWGFPKVKINPVVTQIFYITGSSNLEGNYAWITVKRNDVGTVGELSGYCYIITANAIRNGSGKLAGQIVANVMKSGTTVRIISYRITR